MVNLLAWRENLRRQKKQRFWLILSMIILTIISILFIWYIILTYHINKKIQNNINIKKQLVTLDKEYFKASKLHQQERQLVQQTKNLQILRNKSQQVIQLFKTLSIIVPQGVHLTEVDKKDNKITLIGVAQLNIGIIEFMENIKQSKLLNKPDLQTVKSNNAKHKRFIIKCLLN